MPHYLARRIALAVPVLFGISAIAFGALRLAPGDPAVLLIGPAGADLGTVEAIRHEWGLDRPIHEQYLTYMHHVLMLDFGRSVATQLPVADMLASRYPVTITLALLATATAMALGVSLGVLAARFQRSWVDYLVMLGAVAGLSVPNFVLGLVLVLIVAVNLGVLPTIGIGTPAHYVLPVVTIAVAGVAVVARQTRAAMITALNEDYVRTARAKGLTERAVLRRHALRNALNPIATTVGLIFGNLLAGSIIVEVIFAIPGLGSLMVDGIDRRDYPVIQGAVLAIAFVYVLVNLLVDLAYVAIDPRVRLT